MEFEVLYYKAGYRKVHKNKGASKKDGRLSVKENGKVVLIDNETVVTRGTIHEADFAIGSTYSLGSVYQIEIVTRVGDEITKNPPPKRRKPLHTRPRNAPTIATSTNNNQTNPRIPPKQPIIRAPTKGIRRPASSISAKKSSAQTLSGSSKSYVQGRAQQAHLLPDTKTYITGTLKLPNKKPTVHKKPLNDSSTANVLPHLPLPHSIRSTLKPHQIQGVDFLHRALQQGGAILADEMGLGESFSRRPPFHVLTTTFVCCRENSNYYCDRQHLSQTMSRKGKFRTNHSLFLLTTILVELCSGLSEFVD